MNNTTLTMNGFEEMSMDEMMAACGGGIGYEVAAAVVTYTGVFLCSGPVGIAAACAGAGLYFYDAYKRK